MRGGRREEWRGVVVIVAVVRTEAVGSPRIFLSTGFDKDGLGSGERDRGPPLPAVGAEIYCFWPGASFLVWLIVAGVWFIASSCGRE